MSLEDIDSVYEFEDRWVRSGKLVLVVSFALVLLTLTALLVLLTANEATPHDTVALSAIAVLIGGWLSWVAFRYYTYIEDTKCIRDKLIIIDNFLTEVIDDEPGRRERLEDCRNRAQLHNAVFQVMFDYINSHDRKSGDCSDCVLLATCFRFFSMSATEKQLLTEQLQAT